MSSRELELTEDFCEDHILIAAQPTRAEVDDTIYDFFRFNGMFLSAPGAVTIQNPVYVKCGTLTVPIITTCGFVARAIVTEAGDPIHATFDWTTSAKILTVNDKAKKFKIECECKKQKIITIASITIDGGFGSRFFAWTCPACGAITSFHGGGPDEQSALIREVIEIKQGT